MRQRRIFAAGLIGGLALAASGVGVAPGERAIGVARAAESRRLACLSSAESREAMQAKKAMPPIHAASAAMREGGDLVSIRLCRQSDTVLVYDVAILRRDGRLVHVMVDAGSGEAVPAHR